MVESPRSDASHDSDHDTSAANARTHAVKDKECPFCHQRFTSSSLGRHLDQYITKKKPDGLHNVEEIRGMRGGITRRTARQNSAKQERQGSSHASHLSPPVTTETSPIDFDLLNGTPAGGVGTRLNAANWHQTGVINDIPGANFTAGTPNMSTPTSGKRNYAAYAMGQRDLHNKPMASSSDDKDTARALELALREVLGNLSAATSRVQPPHKLNPFDFDLRAQTFPSLVLLILPTPQTIFSTSPFSPPGSVPVDGPPNHIHLDALRVRMQTVIHRWKWDALGAAQRSLPPHSSTDLSQEHESLSHTANQYEEVASVHLDQAYAAWMAQTESVRAAQWQLELTRALVRETEKRKEAEESVERVLADAQHLSQQVEQLSRCQWPREMALWPPERAPLAGNVAKELRKTEEWDYERLVGKWRKIVTGDRTRRLGVLASASMAQRETLVDEPDMQEDGLDAGARRESGMRVGASWEDLRRKGNNDLALRHFKEGLANLNGGHG